MYALFVEAAQYNCDYLQPCSDRGAVNGNQLLPWVSRCFHLLHLDYHVTAPSDSEKVPQICQRTDFHLSLSVLVFCTHVRDQRDIWELEESRVDLRFVRKHIQPY